MLAHFPCLSLPHHSIFYLVFLFLQPKPENAVTVAVSSRVLFRTEREQKVFEQKGVEEYLRYQIEHETEPFAPGPAFPFVKVKVTPAHTYRHIKWSAIVYAVAVPSFWADRCCILTGSGGGEHSSAGAVPTKWRAVWHRFGDVQPRTRGNPAHQHHQSSQWVLQTANYKVDVAANEGCPSLADSHRGWALHYHKNGDWKAPPHHYSTKQRALKKQWDRDGGVCEAVFAG